MSGHTCRAVPSKIHGLNSPAKSSISILISPPSFLFSPPLYHEDIANVKGFLKSNEPCKRALRCNFSRRRFPRWTKVDCSYF